MKTLRSIWKSPFAAPEVVLIPFAASTYLLSKLMTLSFKEAVYEHYF